MKAAQVIVGLTLNINMSPEEMVQYRIDSLQSFITFEDIVSAEFNGRPAATAVGVNPATQDQTFLVAVDLGDNDRALLSARLAAGELDIWRETLYYIISSITFH